MSVAIVRKVSVAVSAIVSSASSVAIVNSCINSGWYFYQSEFCAL